MLLERTLIQRAMRAMALSASTTDYAEEKLQLACSLSDIKSCPSVRIIKVLLKRIDRSVQSAGSKSENDSKNQQRHDVAHSVIESLKSVMEKYEYSSTKLLDDLHHLQYEHGLNDDDNKFDAACEFFKECTTGNDCDVNECPFMMRHYRKRGREDGGQHDAYDYVLFDIMAQIQCYFFHSFDTDRLAKEERDRVDLELSTGSNDDVDVSHVKAGGIPRSFLMTVHGYCRQITASLNVDFQRMCFADIFNIVLFAYAKPMKLRLEFEERIKDIPVCPILHTTWRDLMRKVETIFSCQGDLQYTNELGETEEIDDWNWEGFRWTDNDVFVLLPRTQFELEDAAQFLSTLPPKSMGHIWEHGVRIKTPDGNWKRVCDTTECMKHIQRLLGDIVSVYVKVRCLKILPSKMWKFFHQLSCIQVSKRRFSMLTCLLRSSSIVFAKSRLI